ncbi:dihydroneopterin aldolase [Streptomyces hyaluromycini]|uniref:dihydroneopterin aldolase n=1 Tax=Streptomyces hyaluromycini TaxID=1377993 RepID=UPI00142D3FD8|nr:dihydroneopterin aldolase [Streptomyces hyaluromycini]
MTDSISLRSLKVRGNHGWFDFERVEGQEFVIDAVLEMDLALAAATDDLADTFSYIDLGEKLQEIVAGEPVKLIETLAERLVAACLSDQRVSAATITVHKPQAQLPFQFEDVAVTIRREQQPQQSA